MMINALSSARYDCPGTAYRISPVRSLSQECLDKVRGIYCMDAPLKMDHMENVCYIVYHITL